MKALTTLFVIGMFATTVAMADDAEDVKAAMLDHYAKRNAGDADAYVQLHSPNRSNFGGAGQLLNRSDSLEDLENQKNNLQAQLDAGVKFNVQIRHPEVEVYGNVAVVTGYTVGTITSPDGTTRPIANRRTVVLIKQAGQWRAVHGHSSPMRLPQ